MQIFFSRIISISGLITSIILVMVLVFTSVGDGSPEMGQITGKVTIFQKKLFGKLKEKGDMSGAIVYVTGFKSEASEEVPNIVQKDKCFTPEVLPVVVGQSVQFPNADDIYHNVFSISTIKSFDLGQYKDTAPPKMVTFDKPGLVPIYCNIHPEMLTYVIVLENSAYAMTDKDGVYKINNVPAGTYTVNTWLPKAKRASQEIKIQPGQEIEVYLELNELIKVLPHKRKDGSKYPKKAGKY